MYIVVCTMSSLINDSAVPDKLVQDACQFPDYPETFVAIVQVDCYYRGTEKKKKKKKQCSLWNQY